MLRSPQLCDDGSLSEELGKVKRSGDKKGAGIVYERVAEIGLLGGLGCGGVLVQKAVKHLEESKEYDYIVLQATKMAIPFYERCGFVRVGAIAKFNDNPNMPYVSYRHWSDIVAGTAVEASYMMGMRVGSKRTEFEKKNSKKRQKEEKITPKTEKKRELERKERDKENAVEVSHSLILQAINTSVDEDGGGSAFKELVALAKESAKEAQDLAMTKVRACEARVVASNSDCVVSNALISLVAGAGKSAEHVQVEHSRDRPLVEGPAPHDDRYGHRLLR